MNSWTTYQKYGIKLNSPYQAGVYFLEQLFIFPRFWKLFLTHKLFILFYGFIRWIGENNWFLGKKQLNFG